MAKTSAKAQKKPAAKAKPAVKAVAKKPVAKKVAAKPATKKAVAPAKKAVAKPAAKPVAKKAASKPVAKKVAVPAKKVVAPKKAAAPKKVQVKAPAAKPSASAAPTKAKAKAKTAETRPATEVARPASAPAARPAPVPARPVRSADTVVARAQPGKAPRDEDAAPRKREKMTGSVRLPANYRPTLDEEYMSPRQIEYFRLKLIKWREDLIEESKQTIDNLRDEVRDVGDEAERAQRETENSLELRTRDRYRKLLSQIDKALKRIEEGEYGFCEETGEPIGIERLEVRPIARFSIDAQERWELRQKHMGE